MAIYQEKNKEKWTKDGRSWYYKCYYTDMFGNRKQKVSKLFAKKKIAEDEERKFLIEIEKKDKVDSNIMFIDVYNEWLDFKKTQVKSSTFYTRKTRANKYILPFFEKYKITSIKVNIINDWKNELNTLEKVKIEHKNKLIADLKEILEYARDNYEYDGKIVSKLSKYKVEEVKKERDSISNFWTNDDFNKFIKVVDNELYFLMFNFLYYTGLRFGEMLALNWNDIDLEKKEVKINKTLTTRIENKKYLLTTPKTKNSVRIVDLDDYIILLLKKHLNNEKKLYNFDKGMFVFGNVNFISATTFKRKLNQYIEISKVKKITPHGFRHSHVSLLVNLGCDSKDVAERIGDTIQMVEKTYYHMFPSKKKKTIELLNNINQKK